MRESQDETAQVRTNAGEHYLFGAPAVPTDEQTAAAIGTLQSLYKRIDAMDARVGGRLLSMLRIHLAERIVQAEMDIERHAYFGRERKAQETEGFRIFYEDLQAGVAEIMTLTQSGWLSDAETLCHFLITLGDMIAGNSPETAVEQFIRRRRSTDRITAVFMPAAIFAKLGEYSLATKENRYSEMRDGAIAIADMLLKAYGDGEPVSMPASVPQVAEEYAPDVYYVRREASEAVSVHSAKNFAEAGVGEWASTWRRCFALSVEDAKRQGEKYLPPGETPAYRTPDGKIDDLHIRFGEPQWYFGIRWADGSVVVFDSETFARHYPPDNVFASRFRRFMASEWSDASQIAEKYLPPGYTPEGEYAQALDVTKEEPASDAIRFTTSDDATPTPPAISPPASEENSDVGPL